MKMEDRDDEKFKTGISIVGGICMLIFFILILLSMDVSISHETEVDIVLYMFLFGGVGAFLLLMALS